MLTREEIIGRTLAVMDELGYSGEAINTSRFPIDTLLEQCGTEVLIQSPAALVGGGSSFAYRNQVKRADGTGTVALMDGFIKLVEFKMADWLRPVYEPTEIGSKIYRKHFYRATRAGMTEPMVTIKYGKLEYFSVPKTSSHQIETALCLVDIPVGEQYPGRLIDLLVWLTASKALRVMNEAEAAGQARNEYESLMNNLSKSYR